MLAWTDNRPQGRNLEFGDRTCDPFADLGNHGLRPVSSSDPTSESLVSSTRNSSPPWRASSMQHDWPSGACSTPCRHCTVRVVDRLEVVQVEEQHRDRERVATRSASASSRWSWNIARFGSPVSRSWYAMCSIRSAVSFVAVTSNITPWTSNVCRRRSRTIAGTGPDIARPFPSGARSGRLAAIRAGRFEERCTLLCAGSRSSGAQLVPDGVAEGTICWGHPATPRCKRSSRASRRRVPAGTRRSAPGTCPASVSYVASLQRPSFGAARSARSACVHRGRYRHGGTARSPLMPA